MNILDKFKAANVKGIPIVPRETLAALLPRLQEERTKSFSGLALTLTTIAVFAFFAINPTLSTITDLQKQLSDSTFVNTQLQTKIDNLTTLQEAYNTMSPDLPTIMLAVPSSAQIPYFFGQLQALAVASGVNIAHIQSFPVQISTTSINPNPYQSFSFNIDGTGTTNQIDSFLGKMSTLNRLITTDSLSINAADAAGMIRFSIKGTAFFKQL